MDQTLTLALEHHRAGRLTDAEKIYRQVLEKTPGDARALHLLGVLTVQSGGLDAGIELIQQAVKADPNDAAAHSDLGVMLRKQGRLDESRAALQRAIQLEPQSAEFQSNLGNTLKELDQLDEAVAAYEAAVKLKPEYARTHYNLGSVKFEQEKLEEAIAAFQRAIQLHPDYADAFTNLGNALKESKRLPEAIAAYQRAIQINPSQAISHVNLGTAYKEDGQLEKAFECYRHAMEISPELPEAYNGLADVFLETGQTEKAMDACNRAMTLRPDYSDAEVNLANAMVQKLDISKAITHYRQVIHDYPQHVHAHWNCALALLMRGDFVHGWKEYEWRWKSKLMTAPRSYTQPLWEGQELGGKTILLHPEQGLGDAIHFARYVPMVKERGGRVILESPPELRRLLQRLPGVAEVVRSGETLPAFDVYCPLHRLPLVFGTKLLTIPANVPYLRGDGSRKLDGSQRHIGLVWAGNPKHKNDRNRSMALKEFLPLSRVDATLHSLQVGPGAEQIRDVPRLKLVDHASELKDFADTAALVEALDLVITVDTSVAHLAGAMGKAVWLLLPLVPEWRWMLDREDSPWYPTMRLFRQTAAKDWAGIVARVVEELRRPAVAGEYDRRQDPAAVEFAQAKSLRREGKFAESIAACRRVIEIKPDHAEAWVVLGNALNDAGNKRDAIEAYDWAIGYKSNLPEAHYNRANVLNELKKTDEALAGYFRAIYFKPNWAEAQSNLGGMLAEANRWDEAIAAYRKAAEVKPESAEIHSRLSGALQKNGQWEEALAAARQAIDLKPDFAQAHINLGNALVDKKDLDGAIAAYRRAIELNGDSGLAHFLLGNALCGAGRTEEGIAAYRQTLRIDPDHAGTHWNLALALLRAGRLLEGWEEFEWRLADKERGLAREFTQKQWDGSDIGGTVLLHAEGGMGDAVQFIRYVPLLQCSRTRLILECHPALTPLLANVPGLERLVERGQTLPGFDYHIPLQGLPRLFKTELTSIPAKVPYLHPPTEYRRRWSERMRSSAGALKVGLVWSGSRHGPDADDHRSNTIEVFAPLAGVEGVRFYSLQKGVAARQRRPEGLKLLDFGAALNDMADAAALMEQLDLIISVDTSTAHLAGALARPVWVLLPRDSDFRWLANRNDSPWYPTMRLFRQRVVGDWKTPVEEMAEALKLLARERK